MILHSIAAAEPYPWPYDGSVATEHLALLLAGWDHAWSRCEPDSPTGANPALRIVDLAGLVADAGGRVVTISHRGSPPLSPPHHSATAVAAAGIDGFYGSPLDNLLRQGGITHLVVAGYCLEGPVHSTLRSANDRGYECLLLTDLSVPGRLDLTDAALSTVTMSGGIFGAIVPAAELLGALSPLGSPDPERLGGTS